MLPRPHPAVVFNSVSEGAVLLHTESEVYLGLNRVGAQVWELLPSCDGFEELRERVGVTATPTPRRSRSATMSSSSWMTSRKRTWWSGHDVYSSPASQLLAPAPPLAVTTPRSRPWAIGDRFRRFIGAPPDASLQERIVRHSYGLSSWVDFARMSLWPRRVM